MFPIKGFNGGGKGRKAETQIRTEESRQTDRQTDASQAPPPFLLQGQSFGCDEFSFLFLFPLPGSVIPWMDQLSLVWLMQ